MPDYALVRVKNTKEMAPVNEVLVWHRASMLVWQRHLPNLNPERADRLEQQRKSGVYTRGLLLSATSSKVLMVSYIPRT